MGVVRGGINNSNIMRFPEEIIEEFLIRMPLKSVTKFKSVSNGWNNLISRAEFRRRYQSRHRNTCHVGFLYHPISYLNNYTGEPLQTVEPAKFVFTKSLNIIDNKSDYLGLDQKYFGEVIGSSKGLLLLSRNDTDYYYVYDLLTKKLVHVPQKHSNKYDMVIGFICKEREENDIVSGNSSYLAYKIVCIINATSTATMYKVESYSSETRNWQISTMTASSKFSLYPQSSAKVLEGVLYWANPFCNIITAYDPEDPNGRATLIEYPVSDCIRLDFSSTQEGQILCITEADLGEIDLWVLGGNHKRGCYLDEDFINRNRWTLSHRIDFMEFYKSLLDFRPVGLTDIEFVGIHPEDSSVIYLRRRRTDGFISYNLKEKRVESIILEGEENESYDIFAGVFFGFEWPSWPCL